MPSLAHPRSIPSPAACLVSANANGYAGENIAYGYNDARGIVMALIVDDRARRHRANIFSAKFGVAALRPPCTVWLHVRDGLRQQLHGTRQHRVAGLSAWRTIVRGAKAALLKTPAPHTIAGVWSCPSEIAFLPPCRRGRRTRNSWTECSDKEPDALVRPLRSYSGVLKALIMRIIHNEAESDDLLQEIYMELWNHAQNYSATKGKPLGWMVTLARRRSIDRLRKRQSYARAEERLQHEIEHQPDAWVHNSRGRCHWSFRYARHARTDHRRTAARAAAGHRIGVFQRNEPA